MSLRNKYTVGEWSKLNNIGDSPTRRMKHVEEYDLTSEIINSAVTPDNSAGFKADNGKPKISIIFKQFNKALTALAERSEFGHQKYIEHDADYMNWKRVPNPKERYLDAAYRHLGEHSEGNLIDQGSNQPHILAAFWNLAALTQLELEDE